ncbi:hypothetical protein B296_00041860 [Ensete ventricosum]|uniref:Glyoxalase/fosfomycin resistance/dioxygenase domain-containing protein n=1 Tax=Ensete ventricosum TaxID=4639 RepID=A0A426Z1E7_ENSVE|nr:hypothetical protein B296_00041860 [Ensete ventricosum]
MDISGFERRNSDCSHGGHLLQLAHPSSCLPLATLLHRRLPPVRSRPSQLLPAPTLMPSLDMDPKTHILLLNLLTLSDMDYFFMLCILQMMADYGVDKYDIGTGFGHFGIAVEDVRLIFMYNNDFFFWIQVSNTVDLIKAKGGNVTREPGPVKGGRTVIAFIEDPDGYKFELLERGPTPEPLCQVMLCVGDLDRSINFYEKVVLFEI